MTYEEIKVIKEKYENTLSLDGVNAIGIGYKNTQDSSDDEFVLMIYVDDSSVANKIMSTDTFDLNSEDKIPVEFISNPPPAIDVLCANVDEDINDIFSISEDYGRYRPLIGGVQISVKQGRSIWYGTLGAFVKSTDDSDNNLYLLSNKHVLLENNLEVMQPLYGKGNEVAKVSYCKEFNNADCALAKVSSSYDVAINVIEEIGIVNETAKVTKDILRQRVIKRGRTTLLTEGTIESINASVQVGDKTIKDCVVVRADKEKLFSNAGDSGSPVVLKNGNKLVGLHFAGNKVLGGTSIFCDINNVFNNLNVKLPD